MTPEERAEWRLTLQLGHEVEAMRELLTDLRRHFTGCEVTFKEQPASYYRDAIDKVLGNDGEG